MRTGRQRKELKKNIEAGQSGGIAKRQTLGEEIEIETELKPSFNSPVMLRGKFVILRK